MGQLLSEGEVLWLWGSYLELCLVCTEHVMFLLHLATALVLGACTIDTSPVMVGKLNDKLRIVNDTITQRLHQLLDTIKLRDQSGRTPRTLAGLPGTEITVGAIDLAIQALGGEVEPTEDETNEAVVVETELEDPGVAVRLIDFIITALGGEEELPQNKKGVKKKKTPQKKIKKKKKPSKKIKQPVKNGINRKTLLNAVISALKET